MALDKYIFSLKILTRNERVNAFAIFIGSLGDQAEYLAKKLPSGKGFVCLDTRKIPEIMKTIFTSTDNKYIPIYIIRLKIGLGFFMFSFSWQKNEILGGL